MTKCPEVDSGADFATMRRCRFSRSEAGGVIFYDDD